jgi:methyl acetate hydrolase
MQRFTRGFTRREISALTLALGTQPFKLFAASNGANNIDAVLRTGIQQRKIPCVTAVAGTASAVTYSGAFGTRDAASGVAVTVDSIFSIASMTKAITSAGAMQLVEQGKMTLDEPASKHLPELGMLQVLDGFDASGKPMLRPAVKPVTLRQLLTHTSGFAYDTWHDGMFKLTSSGADATHVLAFEPGSKWQYGPSTLWAGRLVEAVNGMDLEKYLQQNVLGPLGMKDTTFIFPKEKFERLVGLYRRQPDGTLMPAPRTLPAPPATYRGDGGLFSTAPDYLKFTQMILKRGAGPGGERILKEKTVALMSANGTGHIPAGRLKTARAAQSSDVDFHPGHDDRYTLGFLMNPEAIPGERSAGSLAWAGIDNTYYWIDPKRGVSGVIMMQFLPFADKEAVALLDDFQRAVYTSRT